MSKAAEIMEKPPIITASFLVLGNVLGVGALALPIKTGLAGFVPALIGIISIWAVMLITAWVIAYRIGDREHFDIPSFYHQEVGNIGKWVAIACNLLLLYGVLVAYLSGVSTIISSLFNLPVPEWVVTVIYFCLTSGLVLFGMKALRKGNLLVIVAIWMTFALLVFSGSKDFTVKTLLSTYDWGMIPVGLPIVVSAFHFHNIIPTVCRALKHDQKATRKAIFLGVFLGLVINLIWVVIVLGSLPENGAGKDTIVYADSHNWPANIPMWEILHSELFKISGAVFALLAVTASYMANGAGLYGFVKDLTHTYFNNSSKWLVGILSFAPPLIITLIYPNIFLVALTLVGGVGESILFVALPGFILIRLARGKSKLLVALGAVIFLIGTFVTVYVIGEKCGLIVSKSQSESVSEQKDSLQKKAPVELPDANLSTRKPSGNGNSR